MHFIQGLDKEILELSLEEDIAREIEETDLFCSHVELVLAKMDEALAAIAPKEQASGFLLEKSASEAIARLSITNGNYEEAIAICDCKQTYG